MSSALVFSSLFSTITVGQLDDVINRISKSYATDHKCSEAEAVQQIKEKLGSCKKEAHGATVSLTKLS